MTRNAQHADHANVMIDLDKWLQQGLLFHQAGRLQEASKCYGGILKQCPHHFDALQLLGTIHLQVGSFSLAVSLLDRAIALKQDFADTHCNRGNALMALEDPEEALLSYDRAVRLNPNFAEAHANRANALQSLDRLEESIAGYNQAIALNPHAAVTYCNRGDALKKMGRTQEAIVSYDKAIDLAPAYVAAWTNRGNGFLDLQKFSDALASFEKAINLKPDFAEGYANIGNALLKLKRHVEGLASFDKAIALKPDYVPAHASRGNGLVELGRLVEAEDSLKRAIALQPDYAEAYSDLGIVLMKLKRFDEAISCFNKSITLKPNYAAAYSNLGIVLQDLERFEEALAYYEKAISLSPGFSGAYSNQGNVLQELKRFQEAISRYDTAIYFNPKYTEAHSNRGNALQALKRYAEAIASYDKAIEIDPDYAEAHSNRGNAFLDMDLEEAVASYDRAIALKPDYAEAFSNRGNALKKLKRFDAALTSFDQAIMLKPDYVEAYWNKSLLLLLTGHLIDGWALYEYRMQRKAYRHEFTPPVGVGIWRGEAMGNKRLLIHSEQGYGDVIQFCRYLPQVLALCKDVIFEVPKALVSLVTTLHSSIRVVQKGSAREDVDAYCSVMSLPHILKTTVETIPHEIPYLQCDPLKVAGWQEVLGPKQRLRVGLVWSGSTDHKNDHKRSIPLETLLPILALPIDFHSLQKEYRAQDQAVLDKHANIHQHQSDLIDFSDTAALIQCMDLVISVDTSVAHLAGAMGQEVWVLLPFVPDFRWMLDRQDSPWYPTTSLYRQQQPADWASVIESIRIDLMQKTPG